MNSFSGFFRWIAGAEQDNYAQRISSIDQKTKENCLQNYNKISLKSMVKRLILNLTLCRIVSLPTQICGTHTESILEFFFSPSKLTCHLLLNKCENDFSTLICWMVASQDLAGDKINKTRHKNIPTICRLCDDFESVQSRRHLLTDCLATTQFLMDYYTSIERLSHSKHYELCSLSLQRRWFWILGGGTIDHTWF